MGVFRQVEMPKEIKDDGRREILEESIKTICNDRQDVYGKPENSFPVIADFWNLYLTNTLDTEIKLTARNIAELMVLFKVSRMVTGEYKKDNYVDLCGYGAIAGSLDKDSNTPTKESIKEKSNSITKEPEKIWDLIRISNELRIACDTEGIEYIVHHQYNDMYKFLCKCYTINLEEDNIDIQDWEKLKANVDYFRVVVGQHESNKYRNLHYVLKGVAEMFKGLETLYTSKDTLFDDYYKTLQ